jgi:CubicO group peptidase (beta-lactamase class C family)
MRLIVPQRILGACLAFALVAFAGAPAHAQTSAPPGPLDALLRPLARADMPGCAAGVVRDGVLAASGAYGLADVEHGIPIGPETRFDVGSMSKQFLAVTILMLASEGRLSLDDDVHKYLPDLPAYPWKVTLREMLHHTSGLKDYDQLLQLAGWVDGDLVSAEDVQWIIWRQKSLAFRPGTLHSYSDTNYFLLGMIAKRIVGKPLAAVLEERVFRPLGMVHTSLRTDRWSLIPNKAWPYSVQDGKVRLFVNAEEPLGDGGVFSTISDLALWERNFDDTMVGGRDVVAELQRVQSLADGTPNDYAAGLYVRSFRGMRMIEHAGASFGYLAEKMRFPERGLSVIVLCNRRDGPYVDLSDQIANLYLPEQLPAVETAKPGAPKAQFERLSGVYFSDQTADAIEIAARDGGIVDADSGREYRQAGPLIFIGSSAGTLCRCSGTFTFQLDSTGRVVGFTSSRPAGSGPGQIAATYRRMPPAARAALADYAGEYVSEDLATAWCLVRTGSALKVRRRGYADRPLAMIWDDGAAGPGGVLQFKRQGGRVTGFDLRNIRLNSVNFRKLPAGRHPVPAPWRCA